MSSFTRSDRLVTGITGVVAGAVSVLMVGLYFVYSGPPPAANVIGRVLITVAAFAGFMIFAVGLQRLLRFARGGDAGLAGSLAVASLLMYITMTLVASSLELGTVLQFPDGSVDPTLDGPLAAAMILLHGPIARVWIATFLIALTVALARRRVLASGILTGNVVLAVINLLMIPSVYFGMNAAFFYAANGWGADALMGLIDVIWFGVIAGGVLAYRPVAASTVVTADSKAVA